MFLKTIRLQNVRCFADIELAFDGVDPDAGDDVAGAPGEAAPDAGDPDLSVRHWTTLLGENGTGKSTLLRSICLLTAGTEALGELLGEPSDWVRLGEKECLIEATLRTKEGEERRLSLRISRSDRLSDVILRARESLEEIDRALEHAHRNYFVVAYGSSRRLARDRRSHGSFETFRHPRAERVATLFDPAAPLNPLESWAMDLDYRDPDGGLSAIRTALDDFLPNVRFLKIDKRNRRLMFETPQGAVPLEALSEGYQNMAAWVGDLLFRITETFEDYRNPLLARGLLIIDEVDLHLHPKWQRLLRRFLTERLPNLQLLVTTHSPLTAQQSAEGELYFLEAHRRDVRIRPFEGSPRKLLLHQLLMSDAFGLDSDESVDVEQKKLRYRGLRDKPVKSAEEALELSSLASDLSELPEPVRPNAADFTAHVALLQQIRSELHGQAREGGP